MQKIEVVLKRFIKNFAVMQISCTIDFMGNCACFQKNQNLQFFNKANMMAAICRKKVTARGRFNNTDFDLRTLLLCFGA